MAVTERGARKSLCNPQEENGMASTDFHRLDMYFAALKKFPKRKRALSIGDSWFRYPLRNYRDIQGLLALPSRFGLRVNFLDDSYPGRDAGEVKGLYKRWLRLARTLQEDFEPLDLILISLGGNDVIGLDFVRHLSDGTGYDETPWAWSRTVPDAARRWINLRALDKTLTRTLDAYGKIISIKREYAPDAAVITHTYADVTPMDSPYKFLTYRAGPWIYGPATKVGMPPADQKEVVRWLLESFAGLLELLKCEECSITVLDTRKELEDPGLWDNEIHPKGPGFKRLTDRYWVPAIESVISNG